MGWVKTKTKKKKEQDIRVCLTIRKHIRPVSSNENKSAQAYQQSQGHLAEPLYTVQTPNKMVSQWKQTADCKTIAAERNGSNTK